MSEERMSMEARRKRIRGDVYVWREWSPGKLIHYLERIRYTFDEVLEAIPRPKGHKSKAEIRAKRIEWFAQWIETYRVPITIEEIVKDGAPHWVTQAIERSWDEFRRNQDIRNRRRNGLKTYKKISLSVKKTLGERFSLSPRSRV